MTRYRSYLLSALAAGVLAGAPACGDEEKADEPSEDELEGDCKTISDACHHADEGEGEAAACHKVAHDNDTDVCSEQLESCVETCAGHDEH